MPVKRKQDDYGRYRCPACKEWKSRSAFGSDVRRTDSVATYCLDCVLEKSREREYKNRQIHYNPMCWWVVDDPTGEFAPGAGFDERNFFYSLMYGYWPIGMQFKSRNGKIFTVTKQGEAVNCNEKIIVYSGKLKRVKIAA